MEKDKIICPNCKQSFEITSQNYQTILSQISENEIEKRVAEKVEANKTIAKLAKENEIAKIESKLNDEISKLKLELEASKKENSIELKDKIALEREQSSKHIEKLNREIFELENKLKLEETQKKTDLKNKELSLKNEYEQKIKDLELKNSALLNDISEAKNSKDKEITEIKNNNDFIIKQKDEEIKQLKDYRFHMNSKLLGESLEQHCLKLFNTTLKTALPNATFEKDNDSSEGSKGDFIYRESDDHGNELISIMFEMKNQSDSKYANTKNEKYYEKAHKDRISKKCEYAVIVSTLEPENDMFNGIYDASDKNRPNLYVIRPDQFINFINIFRKNALKTKEEKYELAVLKNEKENSAYQFTKFEERLNKYKDSVDKKAQKASKFFEDAINDIDAAIKKMQKTRDDLVSVRDNIQKINSETDDLSVKKLTHGLPEVREEIEKNA